MSLVEWLGHPFARLLTLALLHFLWQGLAVAVILVAVVELLGIRRPAARYACSLAALFVMLACPLATFVWFGAEVAAPVGQVFNLPAMDGLQTRPTYGAATITNRAANYSSITQWIEIVQPYALAAWLIGVTLFAGRLAAGVVGVARLRRQLIPLPLDLASSVERLGRRLGVEALPLVFLSRRVGEAMAVGVIRPLVLIPAAWATEMPLAMLEAVIAHELAHLRRRDLWVNLLQRIVETVLFYHPAVWWLSRRLRQERELCADELAVAATGRRLEYAVALEQVARRRQADVGPVLAAFMRGGKNMRLLQRVQNVLGLGAEGDRSRLWPAGIVALALPLGICAISLGLNPAVADEDKEGDKPRVEREADDDDRPAAKEVDREGKKFFGKEEREDDGERRDKEVRKDGDGKKEGPRDGDAPKKEGPRDGEVKKEGPRDGGFKKEGARDGDRPVKEGDRDRDVKKDPPREGDRPRKEVRKDEPRKERDKVVKKEGGDDDAIYELKSLVSKLMAENERLRAELAAARSGKEYGAKKEGEVRKEGGDKPVTDGQRKEAYLKERPAAERKKEETRKEGDRKEGSEEAELRERKERAGAEEKEAAARERLRREIDKKEGDNKEGDRKDGDKEVEKKDGEKKEIERKDGDYPK